MTREQLKRILDETRDELTGLATPVGKVPLIYPMACDVLASSPVILDFLLKKMATVLQQDFDKARQDGERSEADFPRSQSWT